MGQGIAEGRHGLVGRESALGAVRRAVEATAAGEPRVLTVLGEAGIGKSVLLEALAERAESAGLLVLEGRAAEHERELPFGLVSDLLDDHVSTLHPRRLESLGAEREAELAAVLPCVAQHVEPAEAAGPAERFRYHRSLRSLVELLARERPLALLLDDVHWADEASLELVLHLIRRAPRAPHLLVLAARPVEPASRLLDALRGARSAELVQLEPLATDAALELLADVPDEAQRARLAEEAGGNPLYLSELARVAGDRTAPLPPTLVAAVQQEVSGLPPASRALLDGAAVAGDPFDPELAAAAAGLEEDALVPLDRLVAADLVRPTGTARGFRFRHPVVRRAVYDATPPAWRLAGHERAARALEARGAGPLARAYHVEQAARPGDEAAVEVLTAAAGASAETSPGTAAHWYAAALRLIPEADAARRSALRLPLGATQAAAGRLHDAYATWGEAVGELRDDDPSRPLMVANCAFVENLLGMHAEARRRLESEVARMDDSQPAERVLPLQLALSVSAAFPRDARAMRLWAGRALDALADREAGSDLSGAAVIALGMGSVGALWEADPEAARELADRALAEYCEMPDSAIAVWPNCLWGVGYALLLLERHRDAASVLRRGVRVVREARLGHWLAVLETLLAMVLYGLLELDESQEVVETAEERARLGGLSYQLQWALGIRASIASLRGDVAEVRRIEAECLPLVESLQEDDLYRVTGLCNLAANIALEDPAGAIRRMVDAAGDGLERLDVTWPTWLLLVMVRAALDLDRGDDAERWAGMIEERAERYELPLGAARGLAARAEIALAQGDPESAARLAREAVEAADRLDVWLDSVPARLLLGRALAAAGEREAAERELRELVARAEARGAWYFRDAAVAELRGLGVRLAGPAPARGAGPGELTDREREIAQLVAAGRSNKQVAAAVFLSEKTVEHHLSRVYAKLGVRSRTELAAAWSNGGGAAG